MNKLLPQDVPEALTTLYLRLNGCFTTGLVLHSDKWGQDRGDVDCLAVWHPDHDQSERKVGPDSFLALGKQTELLICEVKSSIQALAFNQRLREDPAALNAVLRWSGLIQLELVEEVVERMLPLLQDGTPKDDAEAGITVGGVRIRALLCCPRCSTEQPVERWCIRGDQMMRYINECLNPQVQRPDSSTAYTLTLWGGMMEPLVSYFKSLPQSEPPRFSDLHAKVAAVQG
jgi:hypothetical protein